MFVEILCCLAQTAAFAGFCRRILGTTKRKERLFTILLFCFTMLGNIWYGYYDNVRLVYAMVYSALFICLAALLFQADIEKKILAAAVLMTVQRFVSDFVFSLFCYAELFFLHVIKGEAQPVTRIDTVYNYMAYVITFGISISVIWCISKYCSRIFENKIRKWYIITAIPLFILVLLSDMVAWGAEHGIMFRSGGDWGIYYDQLFSHGGVCVFSLLSMFAAGAYVYGMHRTYQEQKEKEYYHAQIMAYQLLEDEYRKTERVRHDFKNHIIALEGLSEKKEWESMRIYFRQLKKDADMEENGEISGNSAIDALLCQKRKLAEEKSISWECDIQISSECPVNTYDLCVLLGNALDNAIEACERIPDAKKRFLMMYSKIVKKCFLLEIKNSTDMQDIQEMEYSRKRNGKAPGLGFTSIREVVYHYQGTMNVEVKNNMFSLSILIPIPISVSDAVYDSKPNV